MRINLSTFQIVATLFVIAFLSCANQDEIPTGQQNNFDQPIYYLALGDSYTIGEGVEEALRWPNQLSNKLEENDYKVELTDIVAQTGWTTNDLLNAIENIELKSYNLVSLLIGVNNQFQNRPFETFNTEFDLLLGKSIQYAGIEEKVFVVSIPDYGVTPFGNNNREEIAEELDMYNDYIRQRCEERNIPFVDITGISRQLGDSPGALAPDNLHPSGDQYADWVEEILPKVIELLME